MIIAINLVVILASILLGTAISNMIVGTLDRISVIIQQVALGDLTAHFVAESKDELGVMSVRLEKMLEQTWDFINKVNQGIDSIANYAADLSLSAEGMSTSIEQLSHNADHQRSETERMAVVMAEMSGSIDEVSRSAQSSLAQLETALGAVRQDSSADEATKSAMENIAHTTDKIAQAIGLIREITHQANLFSLNAAFGAAKVGEQGKGFAAMVEEARTLTKRSAESAMEVVRHNIEARDSVKSGSETMVTTMELLRDINVGLDRFAVRAKVAAPTSEQSRAGADAAGQAESSDSKSAALSSVTSDMSLATSEVARTATELARLASELQSQISKFKLD